MSSENPRQAAREQRRNGKLVKAGDYYTIAGHEGYAKSLPDSPWFGAGLVDLQRAGICYRMAGESDTCANRSKQGILIAEDMINRVFREDPDYYVDRARRGVWYEHIGDFRNIGEFGDPEDAYEDAVNVYQDGNDPDTFYAEQEQIPLMGLFTDLSNAVGRCIEPIDRMENDMTLVDWIRLKRTQLPDVLQSLCEQGAWP